MRLINTHTVSLEEFIDQQVPPYAILSHTWDREEVTYEDMNMPDRTAIGKNGLLKIEESCRIASPDYEYIWIDSCCIDKTNPVELSKAVNSMFRWYADAKVCFAFLADFDLADSKSELRRARWFTRGWTLQELVAPPEVHFYDASWSFVGKRSTLCQALSNITKIDETLLAGTEQREIRSLLRRTTVAKRMSWATNRETTVVEDIAYCLLGIFGVNMPLMYGEGAEAFIRLQVEIIRDTNDLTLFGWQTPTSALSYPNTANPSSSSLSVRYRGILAIHPSEFAEATALLPTRCAKANPEFSMSNKGLRITIPLRKSVTTDFNFMPLYCHSSSTPSFNYGIHLKHQGGGNYVRAHPEKLAIEGKGALMAPRTIYLSKNLDPTEQLEHPLDQPHEYGIRFVFVFKNYPIRLVSAHPEREWDPENYMFNTSGAPNFTGYLIFYVGMLRSRLGWLGNERFVVACGFSDEKQDPWVSVGREFGPVHRHSLFDGQLQYFEALTADLQTVAAVGKVTSDSTRMSWGMYPTGFSVAAENGSCVWRGEPVGRIRVVASRLQQDNLCSMM